MDTRLTESTMVGLFVGGILGGFVADRVGRLSYYQNDSKSLIPFFQKKWFNFLCFGDDARNNNLLRSEIYENFHSYSFYSVIYWPSIDAKF